MNWSVITGNATAVAGTAYFCSGSTALNITLPTSPSLGDSFTLYSVSDYGWTIVQGAGQQIRCNNVFSTIGSTGGAATYNACKSITLTYCSDNGVWEATNVLGNIDVF